MFSWLTAEADEPPDPPRLIRDKADTGVTTAVDGGGAGGCTGIDCATFPGVDGFGAAFGGSDEFIAAGDVDTAFCFAVTTVVEALDTVATF